MSKHEPPSTAGYHVVRPGTYQAEKWIAYWRSHGIERFLEQQLLKGRPVTTTAAWPPDSPEAIELGLNGGQQ